MTDLTMYYPFFWALCAVIAAFGLIMLDIIIDETKEFSAYRRMKLLDKTHVAITQNRGAT